MLIEPYTSVGNLFFTDGRKQVRNKITEPFKTGAYDIGNTKEYYDHFVKKGLIISYDKRGKINAFEFFEEGPVFNGINLVGQPYNKLVKSFAEIDPHLNIDYNSFTSYKYGIGGNTNDNPEDSNALTEAVIVFRHGYYDGLSAYIKGLEKKPSLVKKLIDFFTNLVNHNNPINSLNPLICTSTSSGLGKPIGLK